MARRATERSSPVRLELVVEALPAEFDPLRAESGAEGHRFLDRLANDWTSGVMRFGRPGEMLLAAFSDDDMLLGVGGITADPEIPEALRMRRFYIRSAFRRTGIGRAIAQTLLESALRKVDIITLNAAPASFRFWESLGFVPDQQAGHSHVLRVRRQC
jgi:GNAT superfamily N-acetyltransferase